MDVHVPAAIMRGLLLRGVDVLTAQLDGTTELEDPGLLDRATELGRVLFSQDDDLLAEAAKRQRSGKQFGGVIYAHQLGITIGRAVTGKRAFDNVRKAVGAVRKHLRQGGPEERAFEAHLRSQLSLGHEYMYSAPEGRVWV